MYMFSYLTEKTAVQRTRGVLGRALTLIHTALSLRIVAGHNAAQV